MKIFLSINFVLWCWLLSAQGLITAAEYFFNEDPGSGNGTALTITAGSSTSGTVGIPLDGLDQGLQTLCLRFRDNAGIWSVYARSQFFILSTSPANQLVAAEYFFDSEPGYGQGTALEVSAASEISESFVIPIPDGLEPGVHVLLLRTRDSAGKWSVPARHLFYANPIEPALDIVAAEFFIDEDPGAGNATALDVEPAGTLSEVYSIPTPETLAEGAHMLYMRVRRADGTWSIYASHAFTVDFSAGTAGHERSFSLYPNPTSNELFLETEGPTLSRVRIIDMQGKLVQDEMYTGRSINMRHLGKGTYLVQLHFADGHAVSKRVVLQ